MKTLVSKMDKMGLCHETIKLQFVAEAQEVGNKLLNYINKNSDDL